MKRSISPTPTPWPAAPRNALRKRKRRKRVQVQLESPKSATPTVRVFVPFLVPVAVLAPVAAETSRRIFAVVAMLLGFYSALAGLHWAPTPPGVFPVAKPQRTATGDDFVSRDN